MVKHKGAANKQSGAYKPPKRNGVMLKHKNKIDKKFKIKDADKKLKLNAKKGGAHILQGESKKKEMKNKLSSMSKFQEDDNLAALEGAEFLGDISEQDIDSDDDLSLDENDLPTPPDSTTTEGDESEEEEVIETNQKEMQSKKDDEEKRTIFVGNLPISVTKAKLKKWFSKYGTVEAVRLRCAPLADPTVPKKLAVIKKTFHKERTNIHGFVRFSSTDEATASLSANGQLFDDTHHLRVDMAGKTGQQKKFDDKKAVFIGNLPFSAEEDQLRDHFADCGDIVCVRIVRDKHTAVGKGFAFINFESRHSVRLALEKDGAELNGRKLRIQKALYNQEVEVIPDYKQNKGVRNKNGPTSSSTNIMKFKKKKKTNNEFEFQGLSSVKVFKHKKLNKKKRKLKRKKEVLKKILNTEDKAKIKESF